METALLTWVHGFRSPSLDAAFVFSWLLGVFRFCAPCVLLAILWHLARRERRQALAWLFVAVVVGAGTELLKALVARPRPTLWPWLLPTSGYSFPSGHAAAGMGFYPLLGWLLLRRWKRPWTGWLLGALVGVFIGVGRLYVGVHWPSDVLAGWALGLGAGVAAVRWIGTADAGRLDSPRRLL